MTLIKAYLFGFSIARKGTWKVEKSVQFFTEVCHRFFRVFFVVGGSTQGPTLHPRKPPEEIVSLAPRASHTETLSKHCFVSGGKAFL